MASLTSATQRLFDSYDPRKSRHDDYICIKCGQNSKKNKLNHLGHMKERHEVEFNKLLNEQRKKIKGNKVQPNPYHIQQPHETNDIYLENEDIDCEQVNNEESKEEDILDHALKNISDESNDSSEEPSSSIDNPHRQTTSYNNNTHQINMDFDEEIVNEIANEIAQLAKKWKKGDCSKAEYFKELDKIVKSHTV